MTECLVIVFLIFQFGVVMFSREETTPSVFACFVCGNCVSFFVIEKNFNVFFFSQVSSSSFMIILRNKVIT